MKFYVNRDEVQALIRKQFPEILYYRYPCDFTELEDNCDIIVKINDQPLPPMVINNHLDENFLPNGTYYLNRISCSCPSTVKRLSQKIRSLFRKKVAKNNCKVHSKEFDVYLRSNQPLSFKKI